MSFKLANVKFEVCIIQCPLSPEHKMYKHVVPALPCKPALCGLYLDDNGIRFERWKSVKNSSKPLCPHCAKVIQGLIKILNGIK